MMNKATNYGTALGPLTPLGAHPLKKGVRFSIFSRNAEKVWLMLFDDSQAETPSAEFVLDPSINRIGDIWSIHVPEAHVGQYYAYRMHGPQKRPHVYRPRHWLLDPYARAVTGHPHWGNPEEMEKGHRQKSGKYFPKGIILEDNFDWKDEKSPSIPLNQTIIYETHARGFTRHPSSGVQSPGTYAGLIEKIPYLQHLGITSLELLPLFEFNELEYFIENDRRANLRNYWGYSTLAFFAPNGRFAAGGTCGQQVNEFKNLVKALHEAGIEIILDVVFNHTAEGGMKGPMYSFRGIENSIFYQFDKDERYANYSGCGNSFNSNHPVVKNFIVDCLRYWVTEYHIDGFRFDLATALTRAPDGQVLNEPPLIREIDEDPILRNTKFIAEAWDAAGAYQVGSFPSPRWSEWNGRFRDDIRSFWNEGHTGLHGLSSRLTGSGDLYREQGLTPMKSINFITCHDGFTLNDLVSYNEKHNELNGEDNRDGEKHNRSFNHGAEGPSDDPFVQAQRMQNQKNLLATLIFSQGIPMLLAGDESSQTQNGNNNGYCQDNELCWIDWSLWDQHPELYSFVRNIISFRKEHPTFFKTRYLLQEEHSWFGPEGHEPDWHHGRTLGLNIHTENEHLFICINGDADPHQYYLPREKDWDIVCSSSPDVPMDQTYKHFIAPPKSFTVFYQK